MPSVTANATIPPILKAAIAALRNAPEQEMHIAALADAVIATKVSTARGKSLQTYISQLVRNKTGHGVRNSSKGYYQLRAPKSGKTASSAGSEIVAAAKEAATDADLPVEMPQEALVAAAHVAETSRLSTEISRLERENVRKSEIIMSMCSTITLATSTD